MNKISILWLRQLKRYWRSKSRTIGSVVQPLLYLLALGYGFGSVFQAAGEGNYIQFLAPGIVSMGILFSAVFSGMEIIWDRQFGFLKEMMVAPMSRLHIMVGRTLGGATVAFIQGLIILCAAIALGFRPVNWLGLIPSLAVMFLIAIVFTAFGTVLASRLADMQGFQLIMNFLVLPIFFLSGALFPLEGLPRALSIITKCNPLTYGIDALRSFMNGAGHFEASLDLTVLAGLAVVFLWLGGYFFKKIQI